MLSSFALDDIELQMARPIAKINIALFDKVSVAQVYQTLLATTSDQRFTFGGQTIGGVRSRLLAAAEDFAAMNDRYSSWGAQAAARVNLAVMPGRNHVRSAFSCLAKAYTQRSGTFAKLPSKTSGIKSALTTRGAHPIAIIQQPQHLRNVAGLAALWIYPNEKVVALAW